MELSGSADSLPRMQPDTIAPHWTQRLRRGSLPVALWAFGFATSLMLLGMWGRTVTVDASTIEETAQTIVDSDLATQRVNDWLEAGIQAAAGIDEQAEHEFPLDVADAVLFEPYIERGWVFTAMKLDPERAQMPIGGWNTNVEPVRMTYEATEFELALPLMSINRAAWMPVAVYVVDNNRMDLEGFETLYANRITRNEHRAIVAAHPGMADFIKPDRWLTRLDRTFDSDDAMEASLYLERARSNTEFRRVFRTRGSLSLGMLLLVLGLTGHKIRRHMRNTTT